MGNHCEPIRREIEFPLLLYWMENISPLNAQLKADQFYVLQLQIFFQHCSFCVGWCRLQIYIRWCRMYGRISDWGVFANSSISKALEDKLLDIPFGKPLPRREDPLPYFIVGDEAFPLKTYLMKPYPSRQLDLSKRIFNYMLSRARRVVENVFGILESRFRVFESAMDMEPERAQKIVLACCALHNYLRTKTIQSKVYPFWYIWWRILRTRNQEDFLCWDNDIDLD